MLRRLFLLGGMLGMIAALAVGLSAVESWAQEPTVSITTGVLPSTTSTTGTTPQPISITQIGSTTGTTGAGASSGVPGVPSAAAATAPARSSGFGETGEFEKHVVPVKKTQAELFDEYRVKKWHDTSKLYGAETSRQRQTADGQVLPISSFASVGGTRHEYIPPLPTYGGSRYRTSDGVNVYDIQYFGHLGGGYRR
jgi:hypothetical protein